MEDKAPRGPARISCPWCGRMARINASGRIVRHVAITDRCIGSEATEEEARATLVKMGKPAHDKPGTALAPRITVER